MAPPDDDVRRKIADALSQVMGSVGEMVTRWVALVEVIDEDGVRALWALAPDDAKAWDTLGMLDYPRAVEYGSVTAEAVRGDS
jgi:hypothetical protein